MAELGGREYFNLGKRRKVLPRQTLSTAVATPSSGNSDAAATATSNNDTGATSNAPSGATTSSPSGPTGRQNPSDSTADASNPTEPSASNNNGSTNGTSQPPSSGPSSDGPTSNPTTQPTSQPPTSGPTTQPTTTPPTTPPTSPPTSGPSSNPTSPPTSDPSSPTSQPSSPPSSQPTSLSSSSDPSTQSSSQPSSPPPTSLPPTSSTSAPPTTSPPSETPLGLAGNSTSGTSSTTATTRDIIAGTVGGAAFLILVGAIFLFYRRHQSKKSSFFKRMQPKPRTGLLDGEDIDDYDLGTPMARYRDYPVSVASEHSRSITNESPGRSPLARDFNAPSPGPSLMAAPMDPHRAPTPNTGGLPPGAAVPHLLGMRAETGSIFREAVWPPPGQTSNFVDPLKAASSVDLSKIIDDVMGPSPTASSQAHPPSAFRQRQGAHTGSASGSTTSLIGDDPFASLSNLQTHSRETSETPLLSKANTSTPGFFESRRPISVPETPGSPMPPPSMGPLFVTNMGPLSPSSTISHSPTFTQSQQQALGQTTSPTVTTPTTQSLTSDGHDVGEAL
ncbi:hypothetical protein DICSQDRAFT_150308 [Dichomitus squalens LYAD-421 SS1]|uniref:REJ domain-containing protein n=1 Tax=Dichomitus squalens (strain LYAD-421) TaxID=732165 RepID=R7SLQ2_DICSQ|nr:uncharacterized protein DICSQDRAFT_150308 [Dichomitus squalens LYAD-421 SS1]EJF56655.1 hypothetical protein DICSQDRAFT_150308 [Dichomitus squalens LYAD-421 SS1]